MAQERKIGNSDKSPTAVEWLVKKLEESGHLWLTDKPYGMDELDLIIEAAKQMEKHRLHKCASFWSGKEGEIETPIFNQYYNETFGKDSNDSNA